MRNVLREFLLKKSIWNFLRKRNSALSVVPAERNRGRVCTPELVFVPAKLKVYEYYSKNYECPQCRFQDIPVIKKGKDGRAHMLYGMASAGTVAWVMYQKFCNGLPYYRQEKDWKQYGVEITRATMANWVIRNSEAFFFLCTNTSTGNFWNVDSQWQMKRRFRFCMNRNAVHRPNHICGCSAAVKTEDRLLSSINTRRPERGQCRRFSPRLQGLSDV